MEQIIFQGKNSEHPLIVSDSYPLRSLRFLTQSRQTCIDLQRPHVLQLAYTRWMMSALLFTLFPERILVVGLGGGALVHFLLHYLPSARLTVVEKSATVIKLARGFFTLPDSNNIQIYPQKAEVFITKKKRAAEKYDCIFLDIFAADAMAAPLYEEAFYQQLTNRLKTNGVLATNLWGADTKEFRRAQKAMHRGCNRQSLLLRVPKRGNVICLGFQHRLSREILTRARRNIANATCSYNLPFGKYWKQLLRNNPKIFFRLLMP